MAGKGSDVQPQLSYAFTRPRDNVDVCLEYVWCSGKNTHHDIRSKCKTVSMRAEDASNPQFVLDNHLGDWNFDGSSTNQVHGLNTEVIVRPVGIYPHPFEKGIKFSYVVLSECFHNDGTPLEDNTRAIARSVFDAEPIKMHPWFGFEQEYVLYKDHKPLGWPTALNAFPAPQGPYYCSSGRPAIGRHIAMEHYKLCLEMGLKVSGTNAEVMPGQWEYQIGPCEGIEAGDHVLLSRWVYLRIVEHYEEYDVSFDSKPVKGDWNGNGMHCNFSTMQMRADGGYKVILESLDRLKETVMDDIVFYGSKNNERLTGLHETSKFDEFTFGVGTRNTSVRIGNPVREEGKGYFEDRRPAGDCDPYLVSSRLFASSCAVECPRLDELKPRFQKTWMLSKSN